MKADTAFLLSNCQT